jgi:hypothetical protein
VEKLTAELERTRKELKQQLEQKSGGVAKSQIDELVWDLGEMRKEAQDARETLQRRLDAQDEQIRTLEQQLEQVVQGAREGSQAIGRTALLDSMKEESTSPRLHQHQHQLRLEAPGVFLAPDVTVGPPPVQVGGGPRERQQVDEEADTGVFQEDAVTSRVDIDVKALLGDEIHPPAPQEGDDEAPSGVSSQDPMFLLSPASITGPGSQDGTPATISVLKPFDVADLDDEDEHERDTVVEEIPPSIMMERQEPEPIERPAVAPVLAPGEPAPQPEAANALDVSASDDSEDEGFQEAEEIPLASQTGTPRAIRTLEVDRPIGIGVEASDELPVPRYLLVIAGLALAALIAALIYYFWPRDLELPKPPPPVAAKAPRKAPGPTPAAPPPTPDQALPDAGPPPDLTAPPDMQVAAVEEPKPKPKLKLKLKRRRLRRLARLRRRRARAILLKRAAGLIRKKQHAEAREALTKALELKEDYRVRELMAWNHDQAGELWPAAHHLKKAIALAPAPVRVRLNDRLGLVMLKLGKKAQACEAFKAAVAASPGPEGIPATLRLEKHCK